MGRLSSVARPEGVFYCGGVRVPAPALLSGLWICLSCGEQVRPPVLRELDPPVPVPEPDPHRG